MKTYKTGKSAVIFLITFSIVALAACKKDNGQVNGGTSSVSLYLSDDPSLIFDHLFLDIQKVEVKAEDDSEAENEIEHEAEHDVNDRNGSTLGGWVSISIRPGIYDLLKFRNGLDTILGTGNFSANKNLRKIRITLGQNNHGVLNGATVPLVVKDKDNVIVLKLDEATASSGENSLHISIDIDASRSVRQHGNEFELKPQASSFNRVNSGGIEGRVLPADAHAVIFAINGTDTSSAIPEQEGEFKIRGLKNG
ncbi:MAG: DUF4382 domain-containing protein, partial [Ginsengibacter sp.]